MAKCPKCDNKITFGQLSRYNIWRPIVCQGCKAKLKFDWKDYVKNVVRLFILTAIPIIIILLVNVHLIKPSLLLIALCFLLLIFAQIKYFVGMNAIKLEEN